MSSPLVATDRDRTLRDWVRALLRARWIMLAVAVVVFAVVAGITFTTPPRYRSTAVIRIENRQGSGAGLLDQLAGVQSLGLGALGRDELETDLGVLRSRRVLDTAIDSLALTVQVLEPLGDSSRVLTPWLVDTTDARGELVLTRRSDGRYDLTTERWLSAPLKLPATVGPGDTLAIAGARVRWRDPKSPIAPARIRLSIVPRFVARARVLDRFDARRLDVGSHLVQVRFEDEDRVRAAAVVRRSVDAFITFTLSSERRDAVSQLDELRRALAEQRRKLSAAEEELRAYQQKVRIFAPEEQATAEVKRIATLNGALDQLTVERAALARLLALVEPRARDGKPVAYRQLATFPSLITNRAIQDLLASLIELENKRAELGVRRTDNNDEMRAYTTRITDIEQQLARVGNQYLESIDQQVATTGQQLRTLSDTLQALPEKEMQFIRLVRERTINNEQYLMLLKQSRIAELQDGLRGERIRVVDEPLVPDASDPSAPRVTVQLLLGFVLAVLCALTVGVIVDQWRGDER